MYDVSQEKFQKAEYVSFRDEHIYQYTLYKYNGNM